MGIDKAGHHEAAFQIDEFRPLRTELQHLLVAAHMHDDAVLHAHGGYDRIRVVHGLDDAVVKDPVHTVSFLK